MSYVEIYNERLHDLLQPYKANARLDPQVTHSFCLHTGHAPCMVPVHVHPSLITLSQQVSLLSDHKLKALGLTPHI